MDWREREYHTMLGANLLTNYSSAQQTFECER